MTTDLPSTVCRVFCWRVHWTLPFSQTCILFLSSVRELWGGCAWGQNSRITLGFFFCGCPANANNSILSSSRKGIVTCMGTVALLEPFNFSVLTRIWNLQRHCWVFFPHWFSCVWKTDNQELLWMLDPLLVHTEWTHMHWFKAALVSLSQQHTKDYIRSHCERLTRTVFTRSEHTRTDSKPHWFLFNSNYLKDCASEVKWKQDCTRE